MAIDTELSSEIAIALLAGNEKTTHELNDLKQIVIKVHSTLQDLEVDSRRSRSVSHSDEERDRKKH